MQEIIKTTIKTIDALQLGALIKQCTNIPFADIDSLLSFIDLKDKLDDIGRNFQQKQIEIVKAFGVKEIDGQFNFTDHKDRSKIEAALNKLSEETHEHPALQSLNISKLELVQMTAGLKNAQVDYIKHWLVKP